MIRNISQWAYELISLYKAKDHLSFHDQICVKTLFLPIVQPVVRIGKWIRWLPPEDASLKFHTDGSAVDGKCSGGGVIR